MDKSNNKYKFTEAWGKISQELSCIFQVAMKRDPGF